MTAWTEIAIAATPAGDELVLRRRGEEWEIRCNGWELMSTRSVVSETALARLACAGLPDGARVLIGGLGLGYTLRAALDALGPRAEITVAELIPAVVAWNRGPLANLAGHPLDDSRVDLQVADVADLLLRGSRRSDYDAILLDIDNGPDAVLYDPNRSLYAAASLTRIAVALRPGGTLAVWSADPSPGFELALAAAGFAWQRRPIDARPGGPEHSIYLARGPCFATAVSIR